MGLLTVFVGLMLLDAKGLPGLAVGLTGVGILLYSIYHWAAQPLEG